MKKLFLSLAAVLLFSGCSLIPHKVEFFQKKVAAFPEPSAKQVEVQKQTAQRAKESAKETLTAVLQSADTNAISPATNTVILTDAVSESLGPPVKPSVAPAPELAQELLTQVAKLNKRIDAFAEKNEKVEGKKIEGTGLLQIPYLVYVGLIVLVLVIAWHLAHGVLDGLKFAGVANPALGVAGGLGSAAMTGIEHLFGKGFSQVVKGGEDFKVWVEKNVDDSGMKQKILDAFASAHKQAQDEAVQNAVKLVTSK